MPHRLGGAIEGACPVGPAADQSVHAAGGIEHDDRALLRVFERALAVERRPQRLLHCALKLRLDGRLDDQVAFVLADEMGKTLGHPIDGVRVARLVAHGTEPDRLVGSSAGLRRAEEAGLDHVLQHRVDALVCELGVTGRGVA